MDGSSLFGQEIFNTESYTDFLFRFILDLVVIYIIGRQIYFRLRKNRDYLFTLFLFNIVIFFVCYMLNSVKLSLGFAFGIFAIFSILRYRTRTVPIKEMTYMFIAISIAILNALSNTEVSLVELIFTNIIIIVFTLVLEKTWVRNVLTKDIIYERIDLIKPENHDQLMEDLRERTGLNITRFEIGRIDFLRDIARIKIFYHEQRSRKEK